MLVTFVVKMGEKIRKSPDFKENPRKITPKKLKFKLIVFTTLQLFQSGISRSDRKQCRMSVTRPVSTYLKT